MSLTGGALREARNLECGTYPHGNGRQTQDFNCLDLRVKACAASVRTLLFWTNHRAAASPGSAVTWIKACLALNCSGLRNHFSLPFSNPCWVSDDRKLAADSGCYHGTLQIPLSGCLCP
jgi:hypothetical protein